MPSPPLFTSAARFSSADLDDDAELWASIDNAAAAVFSRRPLLLKNSPTSPSPAPAPLKPFHTPRPHHNPPPPKLRRTGGESRMVLLGASPRTPLASLPPENGQLTVKEAGPVVESPPESRGWGKEVVSPVSKCGLSDFSGNEGKENVRHCLSGQFPLVAHFKQLQREAVEILEKSDYIIISGNPFIKKTGWRKIACFYNISFEIKERSIEFDDNRNVQRAEFVACARMRCGRFSDGWGSCDRREKRFKNPNHDIPSTAETRAKNKACSDLLGIGDYRHDDN